MSGTPSSGTKVDYVLRLGQVKGLVTSYSKVIGNNSTPVGGWYGDKYILGKIYRRHGELESYINVEWECECYADGMEYLQDNI